MSNISIKINLRQFKSIVKKMKRKDGSMVDCLVLPIESNNFFKGEKGLYIDITAIEIKNRAEGIKDTHLLKQSFPKEVYDSLSDDEKKALPILGNAIVWGRQEPEPREFVEIDNSTEENEDLPF